MKDQTLANTSVPSPNSSTDKVASGASEQVTTENNALVKSEPSPKAGLVRLPARILANILSSFSAKVILLFGISFAGSFAIALGIIRANQPNNVSLVSTKPTNLVARTTSPSSNPSSNRLYALANEIISLVSFGYLSGMPEDGGIKISKNNLSGIHLGKSWTKETAFEPVADLSAPPPLSGKPLQTISPLQLPPVSFRILPDSIPDALTPAHPDDSGDPSIPPTLSKTKPGKRGVSHQTTILEVPETPKDTLGKTLTSGARARATLVNAAVFSSDRDSNGNNPRFVVKLDESLKNPSGKVVLTADTTLVVAVRPLSSKGTAKLEAVSVLVEGKEYDLPAGAITLLDSNGSSLAGLKYGEEETPSTSEDRTNVAKTPNKTAQAQKTEAPSNSDPDTSESTVAPAPEQVRPGNKEAIENVMRKSKFYYIPQGTALKLIVNKTVKL